MNNQILDANGSVMQRSRNLAGIRRYVGNHHIKVMSIDRTEHGEGRLVILFDNGASYVTSFADFTVLRDFVRRWRNVYGASLQVNGVDAGKADYVNPYLERTQ